MKRVIFFLTLLIFFANSVGQIPSNAKPSKEYYLTKSKNQNKTGWILLVGGTAMVVGGAVIFNDSYSSGSNSSTDISGFVLLGGVAAEIASIPFFISASKNKKRAAALSINNQNYYLPLNNYVVLKTQPCITLKIQL
jgi:hypothetical protein